MRFQKKKRKKSNRKGVAAIELILTIPVILFCLSSLVTISQMVGNQMVLDHVTYDAVREYSGITVLGEIDGITDDLNLDGIKQIKIESIEQRVKDFVTSQGTGIKEDSITVDIQDDYSGDAAYTIITITAKIDLMFPVFEVMTNEATIQKIFVMKKENQIQN